MKSVKPLVLLSFAILMLGTINPLMMPTSQGQQQEVLHITATTSIVADAVENVGGDYITVDTLIPRGVDPHDFEPTPSDISTINETEHIFWLGGGAEESLEDLLFYWEDQGKATALIHTINETDLLDITDNDDDDEHDDEHGMYDPHFWMDPVLWQQAVDQIADDLVSLLPEVATEIDNQAQTYIQELWQLHSTITDRVGQLQEDQRFLVTSHDSFSYYTERYNFTKKSLQGISTDSEAGIQEIDALAQYLVDNEIEVVFTESTTPSENIETVLDAARSMGHSVVIGGRLFVGSLGTEDGTDTYIEMMTYNTETIVSSILNPPEPTDQALPYPLLGTVSVVALVLLRRR